MEINLNETDLNIYKNKYFVKYQFYCIIGSNTGSQLTDFTIKIELLYHPDKLQDLTYLTGRVQRYEIKLDMGWFAFI